MKWKKEEAETFWREEGRRVSNVERNVERKKRNGENRDVIKNLKNAGREKRRINAEKKCWGGGRIKIRRKWK
jgi:hypothetical protein